MFAGSRGSNQTLLMVIAAVIVVAGGIYLAWHISANGADMRTYHCSACDKDFQVNVNTLGNSLPNCPTCGKNDNVTLIAKKP